MSSSWTARLPELCHLLQGLRWWVQIRRAAVLRGWTTAPINPVILEQGRVRFSTCIYCSHDPRTWIGFSSDVKKYKDGDAIQLFFFSDTFPAELRFFLSRFTHSQLGAEAAGHWARGGEVPVNQKVLFPLHDVSVPASLSIRGQCGAPCPASHHRVSCCSRRLLEASLKLKLFC